MISVCLAAYNGAQYIEEQIRSILDQLGADDELIVSDDHSTDQTVERVMSFDDPRIRLVQNQEARGYAGNFENALRLARGGIIFLTDQDDVWQPHKVARMLAALDQADFAVSDAAVVDADLNLLAPSHFEQHAVRAGFWHNFAKTRYIGACMAFRRPVLLRALPFPARRRLCAHDYWLAMIAEAYYRVALVHEPLILYRRHGKNASTGGSASGNSLWHKISVRLYCLTHLLGRLGRRTDRQEKADPPC